jgi:hypothetical protein
MYGRLEDGAPLSEIPSAGHPMVDEDVLPDVRVDVRVEAIVVGAAGQRNPLGSLLQIPTPLQLVHVGGGEEITCASQDSSVGQIFAKAIVLIKDVPTEFLNWM